MRMTISAYIQEIWIRSSSEINRFAIFFGISMQAIADFINSVIDDYHIDSSIVQSVQGCLGKEMKVDGWISLILSNRECVILKFDNGDS